MTQAFREGASSVALPDTVLAWAFVPPTLQPNLETLNSLISSGRLEIISDRELRSALAGWGRVLEEMTENEIMSRQYVYSDVDRVLRARMDISSFRVLRGYIDRGTATPDQLGASSEVPVDTEVVGVFATRLATHNRALFETGPVREQVGRIISLIARSRVPQ